MNNEFSSERFHLFMYRAAIDGLRITEDSQLKRTENRNSGILTLSPTNEAEFNMTFMLTQSPTKSEVNDVLELIRASQRPSVLYAPFELDLERFNSDQTVVSFLEQRNIMTRYGMFENRLSPEELDRLTIERKTDNKICNEKLELVVASPHTNDGLKHYDMARNVMIEGFGFGNPDDVRRIMGSQVLNHPDVKIYLAKVKDQGIGTMTTVSGFVENIWNLAVLKEFRKQGVATALLRKALDSNLQQALIANEEAIPVYEKNGFTTARKLKAWVVNE